VPARQKSLETQILSDDKVAFRETYVSAGHVPETKLHMGALFTLENELPREQGEQIRSKVADGSPLT
jgi:hypothetical protein